QGGTSMIEAATTSIECRLDLARPGRPRTASERPSTSPITMERRVPRLARLMALALRFERLVQESAVRDYAELAVLGHVSRARITKIINLLHLAPDIQEAILFLPGVRRGRDPIYLEQPQPLTAILDWRTQRRRWKEMRKLGL